MFKKKKTKIENVEIKKTIFNIPSDEAKKYLSMIVKDVETILNSDKFMEATKKIKVPKTATIDDIEYLVKVVTPKKVYSILTLFINDCFDEVRRILACIFVTDFEEYKKKTIDEMCEDISTLTGSEIGRILGFFHH